MISQNFPPFLILVIGKENKRKERKGREVLFVLHGEVEQGEESGFL